MAPSEMRNTIQALEQLALGVQMLQDSLIKEMRTSDGASRSMEKLGSEAGHTADAMKKASDAAERGSKKLKEYGQTFEDAGKHMKSAGANLLLFVGAAALPTRAAKQIGDAFGSAFERVGKFEQSIYMSSQSMRAMSGSISSLVSAQNIYKDQIQKITSLNLISREASEKVFSSMMEGFKGIRTKDSVSEIGDLAKAFVSLGGSAEAAGRLAEKSMGEFYKMAEARKALLEAKEGKLGQKEFMALMAGNAIGAVSDNFMQTLLQVQTDATQRGGKKFDATGREAFIRSQQKAASVEDASFRVQQEITKLAVPKAAMDLSTLLNRQVEGLAAMYAQVLVVTKGFEMLGTALGGGGFAVSGFGSMMKTKAAAGGGDSAIGGIVQKGLSKIPGISNIVNFMSEGNAIDVRVVNFADMAMYNIGGKLGMGVGSSGIPPGGSPGIPPVMGWGKKMKVGGVVGGVGGLVMGGASGYAEYRSLKEQGISAEGAAAAALKKGATVAAFTVAGSIIGSVIPGVGTILGGMVLGTVGNVVGDAWANKSLEKERERLAKEGEKEEKKDNRSPADINRADFIGRVQAAKQKAFLPLQTEGALEKQYGSMAATSEQNIGYMLQSGHLMEEQSKALKNQIQSHQVILDMYDQFIVEARKANDLESLRALEVMKSEAEAAKFDAQVKSFNISLQASVRGVDALLRIQESVTGEATALRDLHKTMRMGIGVSYEDTIRVVNSLVQESRQKYQRAQQFEEQAAKARLEGTPEGDKNAEQALLDARLARADAMRKEAQAYEEAHAMREGYLDALRSEMSDAGGYASIIPTRGVGNQWFATSMATGSADTRGDRVTPVGGPARYNTGIGLVTEGKSFYDTKEYIEAQLGTRAGGGGMMYGGPGVTNKYDLMAPGSIGAMNILFKPNPLEQGGIMEKGVPRSIGGPGAQGGVGAIVPAAQEAEKRVAAAGSTSGRAYYETQLGSSETNPLFVKIVGGSAGYGVVGGTTDASAANASVKNAAETAANKAVEESKKVEKPSAASPAGLPTGMQKYEGIVKEIEKIAAGIDPIDASMKEIGNKLSVAKEPATYLLKDQMKILQEQKDYAIKTIEGLKKDLDPSISRNLNLQNMKKKREEANLAQKMEESPFYQGQSKSVIKSVLTDWAEVQKAEEINRSGLSKQEQMEGDLAKYGEGSKEKEVAQKEHDEFMKQREKEREDSNQKKQRFWGTHNQPEILAASQYAANKYVNLSQIGLEAEQQTRSLADSIKIDPKDSIAQQKEYVRLLYQINLNKGNIENKRQERSKLPKGWGPFGLIGSGHPYAFAAREREKDLSFDIDKLEQNQSAMEAALGKTPDEVRAIINNQMKVHFNITDPSRVPLEYRQQELLRLNASMNAVTSPASTAPVSASLVSASNSSLLGELPIPMNTVGSQLPQLPAKPIYQTQKQRWEDIERLRKIGPLQTFANSNVLKSGSSPTVASNVLSGSYPEVTYSDYDKKIPRPISINRFPDNRFPDWKSSNGISYRPEVPQKVEVTLKWDGDAQGVLVTASTPRSEHGNG